MKPRKPWIVSTLALVAEFFGVDERTVKTWRNAEGWPCKPGHYDLRAIYKWKASRKRDPASVLDGNDDLRANIRKIELEQALEELRAIRLKNDLAEGLLADRATIEREWLEEVEYAKTQFELIPELIAANIPPELRDLVVPEVSNKIRLILKRMSDSAPDE